MFCTVRLELELPFASSLKEKRQILRSFMVAGDKARMISVAQTEKTPELRQEAV